MTETKSGMKWVVGGGLFALCGLAIILWPERGWTPHPMPFPPSAAARPVAAYAVFGYPFLALGVIGMIIGGVRLALDAVGKRNRVQR